MKDTFLYVLFISVIVALYAFAFSFSQNQDPTGRQVFIESKCNNCHTVFSNEITSTKDDASDLSNAGASGDVQSIKSFLLKESRIDDKEHKIKFKGQESELNSLAEWLASLKTESAK